MTHSQATLRPPGPVAFSTTMPVPLSRRMAPLPPPPATKGGFLPRAFATLAIGIGILWIVTAGVAYIHGNLATPKASHALPIVPLRVHATLGDPATSGLAHWPGLLDVTPIAYDLDGDGVDEIIAQSNDTHVYVFDASTGRVVATLPTTYPPGWYIERVLNGVAAGVLRPGEPPSLVIANHAAYVSVWTLDALQSVPGRLLLRPVWEQRMDSCFWNPGMDAEPVLADVDGDGAQEILVQTEEVGLFALRADGLPLWGHCWAGGNSAPAVADLDADGAPEAVFASDAGLVSVLDGATGAPRWSFDAADPAYGISPASISVTPTVAELDGALPRELLFTARHAPLNDSTAFATFHMGIFAVHQSWTTWQPELLWMRQPEWAHPLSYTRLLVEDVDADGSPDVFGMDWNTIGHTPGDWEPLGNPHVFRLTAQGQDVWVRDVDAWWSNKDILLHDVDADGDLDLLVNGAQDSADGLWRLSPLSGRPLSFLSAGPWKVMRGPIVTDLWHDVSAQLVFPVAPDEPSLDRGALLVLSLGSSSGA